MHQVLTDQPWESRVKAAWTPGRWRIWGWQERLPELADEFFKPDLELCYISLWMVRENQVKYLDFRATNCLKLSWSEGCVEILSLCRWICFLLKCLFCLSRESNAPKLNAVHRPWDMPHILLLVISRKTTFIKVNTGVRSNDNLAYSLQLGWRPRWKVLIQRIINLSPEQPCWFSTPSPDTRSRKDNGVVAPWLFGLETGLPTRAPPCTEKGSTPACESLKTPSIWWMTLDFI